MKKMIDLHGADFCGHNLRVRNFAHTNLRGADLRSADLTYASLYGADLTGVRVDTLTNWHGADLRKAIGVPHIPMVCPSDGPFIGWKLASTDGPKPVLVKLLIPADARRVSGTTRSCRCDKALVLDIEGAEEAYSTNDSNLRYKAGEYVYPDKFTEDRWDNYGHGIYFFIDREEALNYEWR